MKKIEKGVIYVAVGEKSIVEANNSVKSLKKMMQQLSVTVFTDLPEKVSDNFDIIKSINLTGNLKLDRMECFLKSPYFKTIYLDADTLICEKIDELFDILECFDFAIAHSPVVYDFPIDNIPSSFQQMNCGVMVYSTSDKIKRFINMWKKTHNELEKNNIIPGDETSFRKAIYYSDLRVAIIQSGYNFRVNSPNVIIDCSDIKILHGHSKNLNKILSRIKNLRGSGFYIPRFMDKNLNDCDIIKV